MAEDQKTLWIGNLDQKVTEEVLYELVLQTGPIDRLILPTEGEKGQEKHRGHAYIVFKHPESVQYASQVLDGTALFSQTMQLKARSLPSQYKEVSPQAHNHHSHSRERDRDSGHRGGGSRFDRYDNSSLRGGFHRSSTWHGQNNHYTPRSRGGGGYRSGGGRGGYHGNQGSNYNSYHQSESSSSSAMNEKRQRILQQQSLTLEAHRQTQQQQQMGNMNSYQQQSHQQWSNSIGGYNTGGGWPNQGDQSNAYYQYQYYQSQ